MENVRNDGFRVSTRRGGIFERLCLFWFDPSIRGGKTFTHVSQSWIDAPEAANRAVNIKTYSDEKGKVYVMSRDGTM